MEEKIKPQRIKSNPILESITTPNGILVEDRSFGQVVQIWINEAPSIVFKQDTFKRFQNWKWTKNAITAYPLFHIQIYENNS